MKTTAKIELAGGKYCIVTEGYAEPAERAGIEREPVEASYTVEKWSVSPDTHDAWDAAKDYILNKRRVGETIEQVLSRIISAQRSDYPDFQPCESI